eukprot:1161388-Pelagomonas_calceolata.AAC.1
MSALVPFFVIQILALAPAIQATQSVNLAIACSPTHMRIHTFCEYLQPDKGDLQKPVPRGTNEGLGRSTGRAPRLKANNSTAKEAPHSEPRLCSKATKAGPTFRAANKHASKPSKCLLHSFAASNGGGASAGAGAAPYHSPSTAAAAAESTALLLRASSLAGLYATPTQSVSAAVAAAAAAAVQKQSPSKLQTLPKRLGHKGATGAGTAASSRGGPPHQVRTRISPCSVCACKPIVVINKPATCPK